MKRLFHSLVRDITAAALLAALLLTQAPPLFAQAPAKSSPEAAQMFFDATNFQNNGAFDLAAEEYQKFLKRFPEDPQALKARHYLGVCLMQLKKWGEAAGEFEQVVAGDKEFALRDEALLNLGTCRYSLGQGGKPEELEKAGKAYAQLVEEFPKSKYAAEALFFQGEAFYAADKKAEAVQAYDQLVKGYPDSGRRAGTLYALGVTQEELGKFAPAGETYDSFLKEFPDDQLATEVRMRKAETLAQAGKLAEAEKLFGDVRGVEGFALADHATFRQADCALRQKKFAAAGELFAAVASNFPRSGYAADATMSAGQAFYRAGDFAKAAGWYDKVSAGGGKDAVEAAHWRCRIYLAQGQPGKAVELAKATLPKAADSPFLVELLVDQADGLFEQPAQRAESLPLYLKIYEDHPDHEQAAPALYNAAYTALDVGKHAQASTHANAFLEKFPDHNLMVDSKYVAAESLLQSGKYADSEKLYKELLPAAKDRPELPAWQLRLATALNLQSKRAEVVALLTPLMGSFDSADHKAEAQFLLGTCQYHLGRHDEAVKALEASLAANPKSAQADEAWLNLSRAQGKLKRLDAAITSVKRVLEDFPQSKLLDRANFYLAQHNYLKGDFATAIAGYDTVVSNWPDSVLVPYALNGKAWSQLGDKAYAGAEESYTKLIEGYPDNPLITDARSARANCRYHTKNYDGAIADVNKYLESKPAADKRAEALFVRGLSETAARKFADAAQTYDTILKEKPDFENTDRVLYELGWAHKSLDKEDESLQAFTRLTSEHPDSPLAAEGCYHIGESQYNEEQFAAAAKSYMESVQKAGKSDLGEKAQYKLGWANYQLDKFDDALAAFANQVAAYPAGKLYSDGIFMQGECLFKLERYEEALPTQLKCLELSGFPDEKKVLVMLHAGQSAAQTEKWQQAIDLLAKIPTDYPQSDYVPEALYEQGWAQQNLGNPAEAAKLYEAAAEKSRTHVGARARFMLGELHFEEKRYEPAIKEFQRVLFGYGGDQASEKVKRWQSKSAYEIARCNEVQIRGAETPAKKQKYIGEAMRYYQMVGTKYPNSSEAAPAAQRIKVLKALP